MPHNTDSETQSGNTKDFFSANNRGGVVAAQLEHQDPVAVVLAVESLRGKGLLADWPEEAEWALSAETWDDLVFSVKGGRTLIQVKNEILTRSLLINICTAFEIAAKNNSGLEYFYRIQALAGVDLKLKTLPEKLDELRQLKLSGNPEEHIKACDELSVQYSLPASVIRNLRIDVRRLLRDDTETVALFCHTMRQAYPFRDFGDRALRRLFYLLQDELMAPARRARGSVSSRQFAQAIKDAIVSNLNSLLNMEPYVRTKRGYVRNQADRTNQIRHLAARQRSLHFLRKSWRRKQWIRALIGRWDMCAECGHPLMGNFCGLNGLFCPDCRFLPFLSLVYACDCGFHFIIAQQPPLRQEALDDLLARFLDDKDIRCEKCNRPPDTELPSARAAIVPFPLPVEEYFNHGMREYLNRYHQLESTSGTSEPQRYDSVS